MSKKQVENKNWVKNDLFLVYWWRVFYTYCVIIFFYLVVVKEFLRPIYDYLVKGVSSHVEVELPVEVALVGIFLLGIFYLRVLYLTSVLLYSWYNTSAMKQVLKRHCFLTVFSLIIVVFDTAFRIVLWFELFLLLLVGYLFLTVSSIYLLFIVVLILNLVLAAAEDKLISFGEFLVFLVTLCLIWWLIYISYCTNAPILINIFQYIYYTPYVFESVKFLKALYAFFKRFFR